jgi:V/A-type H+-transporting ATPase subunit E
MGAVEIADRITDEVKEEKEEVLSEAREKADGVLKEARDEIELQKKHFIAAEQERGLENKERIIRAARLNAKKLRWTAEEELIGKTLEEAVKRIQAVKSEGFKGAEYSNVLGGLIRDAVLSIIAGGGVPSSELEVVVSTEDASYVNPEMLKEISDEISDGGAKIGLSLSEERIKSVGGVIVRRKDGKIVVNNTFEQRMERFSTSLREDIVKALFKGQGVEG